MGKKNPLILIVYVAAVLSLSFTSLAQGAAEEVTPEMAKKAAMYYFLKTYGRVCSQDYEYFRVSEPKIIESYRGDRKWYNFYFTVGADPLPTRADLADWVKSGKYEPDGGHIFCLDITGDKNSPPCSMVSGGMPFEIKQRPRAENFVKEVTGTNNVKFLRTFYTTSDLRRGDACFEFLVNGEEHVVSGFNLRLYDSNKIAKEPKSYDLIRIRKIWDDINEKVQPDILEGGKIFFNAVGDIIGKSGGSRTDAPKYLFCDDVPNYYRGGSGAPSGDWGCGPSSSACVIGAYHHYYHAFKGPPEPPNYPWSSYYYGWWILGGNLSTPHWDSLYKLIEGMCGAGETPKAVKIGTLYAGFYKWIYKHLPEGLSLSRYGCGYKAPFSPLTEWYTYIDPRFSKKIPIVFLWHEKNTPLSEGHFVTGVGYEEDILLGIILIYYDHEWENSGIGEYYTRKYFVYDDLATHDFGLIYSDEYKPGGLPLSWRVFAEHHNEN